LEIKIGYPNSIEEVNKFQGRLENRVLPKIVFLLVGEIEEALMGKGVPA
jgi:hypothetical protein